MKMIIKDRKLLVRRCSLVVVDLLCVNLAAFLALIIRHEFVFSAIDPLFFEAYRDHCIQLMVVSQLFFWPFRLYSSLWEYAGTRELMAIVFACVATGVIHMLDILVSGDVLPRSYYILFPMILIILVGCSRMGYRMIRSEIHRERIQFGVRPNVMVVGAGEAGNMLIKEIRGSSYLNMRVKCIVDDDERKQGSYLYGIRIEGGRHDILRLVDKYDIQRIIVAIPSLSRREMKPLLEICKSTGCEVQMLPGIYQLVNADISVSRLRKVEIEDLLGRDPVNVDIQGILGYVKDRIILVTGGGGSIGSELCRQIAGHEPKQLVIVDIYENNAYDVQHELLRAYPGLNLAVIIASVRDAARMDEIFAAYRPDIVYHAAAHKHVPLMESSPCESIKNNVGGTLNVVRAADKWGVKRFVAISTDKAVNPTNIMGASKRLCEMIIQTYNKRSKTDYVAVRFGNVLGSNGSVIPLFKKQIEEGGPVTVTHPDIIRYFMTIPEAVSLVLQAGAYAEGGEIFILDMGEPVKILDLATNLISLSGYKPGEDIKIEFTGLRPGEKLYEELLMDEEGMKDTPNKLIHIGRPIELDEERFLQRLEALLEAARAGVPDIRDRVQEMVPTYKPTENGEGSAAAGVLTYHDMPLAEAAVTRVAN